MITYIYIYICFCGIDGRTAVCCKHSTVVYGALFKSTARPKVEFTCWRVVRRLAYQLVEKTSSISVDSAQTSAVSLEFLVGSHCYYACWTDSTSSRVASARVASDWAFDNCGPSRRIGRGSDPWSWRPKTKPHFPAINYGAKRRLLLTSALQFSQVFHLQFLSRRS